MSYILEALKKAQAERQLGNAPTIHAPVVHAVPVSRPRRLPLALAAAAAVVLLGAAWFAWRQQGPAAPAPAVAQPVPAPAVAAAVPPQAGAAPAAAPQVALLPEPVAPPVRKPEPPARKPEPARAAPAPEPIAATPARPAAEETTRGLNELPEAIRSQVPKVVFGGYIYSPNPAERLLLVDKMLRREGEEVAPGLVLEKLLPNAAVMNYRGQRYRVPY